MRLNRRFISIIAVAVAVLSVLLFQATREGTASVLLPSDLRRSGPEAKLSGIRVGGRVTSEPIEYTVEPSIKLTFYLEDPGNPQGSVPVIYEGIKPDMFAPGRDVIIDGEFKNGTLYAIKLLTQCPSKYEPPIPGKSPKSGAPVGL